MAKRKLEWIIEKLNTGFTVYVSTYLKSWEITKKTYDKFESLNFPLFKVNKDSIFMASGKKYVCIDYCKISARK